MANGFGSFLVISCKHYNFYSHIFKFQNSFPAVLFNNIGNSNYAKNLIISGKKQRCHTFF